MTRFRVLALVLAGVTVVALGASGISGRDASATPQAPSVDEPIHQQDGSAAEECSLSGPAEDVAGQPCQDCPKKIGDCGRVSCDPCCYRCPGDPILRCF